MLVVEDHALLARHTARLLERLGCLVVGPVGSTAEASRLAEAERPIVALVDLGLSDGYGEDLVEKLQGLNVACVICTGAERPPNPPAFLANLPWLQKPVSADQLHALISGYGPASITGA